MGYFLPASFYLHKLDSIPLQFNAKCRLGNTSSFKSKCSPHKIPPNFLGKTENEISAYIHEINKVTFTIFSFLRLLVTLNYDVKYCDVTVSLEFYPPEH